MCSFGNFGSSHVFTKDSNALTFQPSTSGPFFVRAWCSRVWRWYSPGGWGFGAWLTGWECTILAEKYLWLTYCNSYVESFQLVHSRLRQDQFFFTGQPGRLWKSQLSQLVFGGVFLAFWFTGIAMEHDHPIYDYPLVNIQKAIENGHLVRWLTH